MKVEKVIEPNDNTCLLNYRDQRRSHFAFVDVIENKSEIVVLD